MRNTPVASILNKQSVKSLQKTAINLLIAVFFLLVNQPGQAGMPDNPEIDNERSFQFTYYTTINNIPDSARSLKAFVPVPESDKHQTISNLEVQCNYDFTFERDAAFGNKILALRIKGSTMPDSISITLSFDVHRQAIKKEEDYLTGIDDRSRHLQADSLIPLDDAIIAEANKVIEERMAKSEMTQSFYNRLIGTMEYDKSGQGWGRGDALFACDKRKGNCTDFHSLFIGMSRVKDIPARFEIGFPIPPDKNEGSLGGYHCWASFYQPDKGWVPVDISEAWKHRKRKQFYYGGLDANRVLFTKGRDIPLPIEEGQDVQLNYFIYPHARVNGQSHDAVSTEFTFRDS